MGGFGGDDDDDGDIAPNMEDLVQAADANRPEYALAALVRTFHNSRGARVPDG